MTQGGDSSDEDAHQERIDAWCDLRCAMSELCWVPLCAEQPTEGCKQNYPESWTREGCYEECSTNCWWWLSTQECIDALYGSWDCHAELPLSEPYCDLWRSMANGHPCFDAFATQQGACLGDPAWECGDEG